jgi:hypothetical protein
MSSRLLLENGNRSKISREVYEKQEKIAILIREEQRVTIAERDASGPVISDFLSVFGRSFIHAGGSFREIPFTRSDR